MFTVSVGHNYEGYSLHGVYGAENLARLLARKLRKDERGDAVKVSEWQGSKERIVAVWRFDYSSHAGRHTWGIEQGQEDAIAS